MTRWFAGPLGGRGWLVKYNAGSPISLVISKVQVPSTSHLVLVLPYPAGTKFTIKALPNSWCSGYCECGTTFRKVNSADAVRDGGGDLYHFDGKFLYIRVVQTPSTFNTHGFAECDGDRTWSPPDLTWEALSYDETYIQARAKFETITIKANCKPASGGSLYCAHGGSKAEESAVPSAAICPASTALRGTYDACTYSNGNEVPGKKRTPV